MTDTTQPNDVPDATDVAAEWAYARHYNSDQARADTYQDWIHSYNHHRPHTGIGGKSPIDRVHNVSGNNT